MELIERAQEFARQKHCVERNQKHGDRPYTAHLQEVVDVLVRFGYGHDIQLITAAWLHDVVEDTSVSREDIQIIFGTRVADLVWAVTNEAGQNRKEKALKTYPKIRQSKDATILKLADRIANVERSVVEKHSLLNMYRKEQAGFEKGIRPDLVDLRMTTHLRQLLKEQPS